MVHTVVWHDLLIISLSQLRIIRSQTLITCISVYPQGTHIFKFIPQLFSNLLWSPKPLNSYSIACSALKPNSCSGVLVTYSRRSIWGSSLTFDWSTTRVYWEIGDFGRVWLGLSICFYVLSQYFIKAWTNEKCQEFHGLSRQKLFGQHSHNIAVYMLTAVTLCKPLCCQLKSAAQVCLGQTQMLVS